MEGAARETELQGRAFGDDFDVSVFARWDRDGDDRLSEEEVRRGLFDRMDEDGDGQLGEDEWRFEIDV